MSKPYPVMPPMMIGCWMPSSFVTRVVITMFGLGRGGVGWLIDCCRWSFMGLCKTILDEHFEAPMV